MKVLHTSKATGRTIAYLDENNYAHGMLVDGKDKHGDSKQSLNNTKYFNTLDGAVNDIVKREADEASADLKSWLEEYKASAERLSNLLK